MPENSAKQSFCVEGDQLPSDALLSVAASGSGLPIASPIDSEITDSPIAMCNGVPAETFLVGRADRTATEHWAVVRRALCAVVITAVADWSLYQSGGGYAGWAMFVIAALILTYLGIGRRREFSRLGITIAAGVMLASARLLWQGSVSMVFHACVLLVLWSMSMQSYELGYRRFACFVATLLPRAIREMPSVFISFAHSTSRWGGIHWLTLGIPTGVCSVFIFLFTMANPDVSQLFFGWLEGFSDALWNWAGSLRTTEVIFWTVVGSLSFGLIVPAVSSHLPVAKQQAVNYSELSLVRYRVGRNTLLAVNLLFAGYLIVELISSWGRIFPVGFYYSGYAHQGAAWLTVALGLTTFVLGMLFRSDLERNEQVLRLRRLAMIWVVLNWFLALAAYHRLSVYVEFNGLTRMRLVGFLGITCVAIGLIWAFHKIDTSRTFGWMLRKQFSTMLVFAFAYSVLPIDLIAHQYNVHRILSGHPEPLVQFTEQPLSDEAWICVAQLTDVEDILVREGLQAMLADRFRIRRINHYDWQHFQGSRVILQRILETQKDKLDPFVSDSEMRQNQIMTLREFAYQWY